MNSPIIECVANFSEGRDARKVEAIAEAIARGGARVLRTEMDFDHHRAVVTFAGAPREAIRSAYEGIAKAAELIDLREHRGIHPRMGAADVVPFVPLEGATLEECAELARELGREVWQRLGVPVYFYEAAALRPECARLENARRGQFEHPALVPDLGGPSLHASAGAAIVGARKLLIAFNVELDTADVDIARAIARKIRASSGGLAGVKAMGVFLASRGIAQVSMNLTDFERTPPHAVFDAVEAEAAALGARILDTEIAGLIPRKAIAMGHARFLPRRFDESQILEERLRAIE